MPPLNIAAISSIAKKRTGECAIALLSVPLPSVPVLEQIPELPSYTDPYENPVDIVTELGVDIDDLPYRPRDPLGWVRDISDVYWQPVEQLLNHIATLKPDAEFTQLPACPHHRTWCKWNGQKHEWCAIALSDLPQFLIPDVESVQCGKESDTRVDPYRPFMCGGPGASLNSTALSWYLWVDHLRDGEELLEVVPFPQDRVIVNHRVTAYDRRYYSCEYEQVGPSTNKYIDTQSLGQMMHGICSQATGAYAGHKKAQAQGAGVPLWVTKASEGSLKALVEHRLGISMNKTVRSSFTDYSASELKAQIESADNTAITPVTVTQYWAADGQHTFDLFVSMWHEANSVFISHPASWVGMTMLGSLRVYVDGIDEFITRTEEEAQVALEKIRSILRRLADDLLNAYRSDERVVEYEKTLKAVLDAKAKKKELEDERHTLKNELGVLNQQMQENHALCANFAFQRETAAQEISKIKGDRTLKALEGEDAERVKQLTKVRSLASKMYKQAAADWLQLCEKGEANAPASALATAMLKCQARLETVKENVKVLKDFVEQYTPVVDALSEHAIAHGQATKPCLDWSRFSSGPRAGRIKWIAELDASEWSHKGRDAVELLSFQWEGLPIGYVLNAECTLEGTPDVDAGDSTGTWATETQRLPHVKGGANLGSPLCNDYFRFVVGEELSSALLSNAELKELFKLVENTNQWISYRKRYREIYREETPFGTLTTTDTLSAGTLSLRTKGLFVVLPNTSDKIGSGVQKVIINPGKDRVIYERDFAAQESKFLAMLVNCWAGKSLSTVWSKAVLTGEKSKKTDIHNLVAIFCTRKLAELMQDTAECDRPVVARQDGKGLNFSSIYLCGVEKLATGLIVEAEFPPALAQQVAVIFMDYIKGPQGIAIKEFEMLTAIANMPHYRTAALGRKIAHSVDYAIAPKDFHTTRSNWTIQSGCTDFLHITATVVWALCIEYGVDAFPLITVHDSLKYSVAAHDVPTFGPLFDFAHAVAKNCGYQGATAWARSTQLLPNIKQIWCPPQDVFFEERLEEHGFPTHFVPPVQSEPLSIAQ